MSGILDFIKTIAYSSRWECGGWINISAISVGSFSITFDFELYFTIDGLKCKTDLVKQLM